MLSFTTPESEMPHIGRFEAEQILQQYIDDPEIPSDDLMVTVAIDILGSGTNNVVEVLWVEQ